MSQGTLIDAVQAVHQTSAECAPDEGTLLDRVNRYVAAIDHCEAVLRETFSGRELARLTGILVDIHRAPLCDPDDPDTLATFLGDLYG